MVRKQQPLLTREDSGVGAQENEGGGVGGVREPVEEGRKGGSQRIKR